MPKVNDLVFEKIEKHIISLISSKQLLPGESLPSERELGRRFKVSQYPVRQATRSLIRQGLLKKIPGKGTFVNIHNKVAANKIAVLFCHPNEHFFASPFYATILTGINQAAQEAEKVLLLRSLKRTPQDDPNLAFQELAEDVCGYILVDPTWPVVNEIKGTFKTGGKLVVVLNYEDELEGVDRVVFNTRVNVAQAVRAAGNAGHTRIGFLYLCNSLFGGEKNPNLINIKEGYRAGLDASGLTYDPDLIGSLDWDRFEDIEGFRKVMQLPSPPTALFLAGDIMARSVYAMVRKLGLSIPEDVSIFSQGGLPEGDRLDPPLSTISFPLTEMGKRGVKVLLEKCTGTESPVHTTTVLSGTMMLKGSFKKRQG